MSHFGEVIHTASGALAISEMQDEQGLIEPLPPSNAKQRRHSRPNTKDEIRTMKHRRKQRIREQNKLMSKGEKKIRLKKLFSKQYNIECQQLKDKLHEQTVFAKEQRARAICFWKKWKETRLLLKDNNSGQIRQIDQENIHDLPEEKQLGEGRFGKCEKKLYRGTIVAVKYFKPSVTLSMVEREAKLINSFDHPGLPFVFGISTKHKPYFMVVEFYGIGGETVTLAKGAKCNLLKTQWKWAESLVHCCEAIAYLHQRGYIHCDIKGDNIVFHTVDRQYLPIMIDFGKMKKSYDAKKYTLSIKEQERYRLNHKHIAPEVVRGTHPQSTASDVYAFGLVISLICHYNKYEDLRCLAVECIHGTPCNRPSIETIISKLSAITK